MINLMVGVKILMKPILKRFHVPISITISHAIHYLSQFLSLDTMQIVTGTIIFDLQTFLLGLHSSQLFPQTDYFLTFAENNISGPRTRIPTLHQPFRCLSSRPH